MFLQKKLTCVVLLAAACSFLADVGATQAATFAPELTLESRYDDNIFKRPYSPNDLVGALIPRLRLLQVDPLAPWELRVRRSMVSYSRSPSPVALSDLVMGRGAYYMTARESVNADYRYTRSSEPMDFDHDGVVTGGNVTASNAGLGVQAWRGDVAVRVREWSYADAGLVDGLSRSWALRAFPLRTRETGWIVGYRGQDLDLSDQGIRSHIVTTGIQREHAGWLSSELELGAAQIAFEDGTPSQRRPAFALGVSGKRGDPSHPITARVRLAHDLTTTGSAELRRGWGLGNAWAKWESALDVEGGVYRRPTRSSRFTLGLETSPLCDIKRVAITGSYRRIQPFRGHGYDTKVLRASIATTLPLNSWLTLEPVYDFYRQDHPAGVRGIEFSRNRLVLSLTAGFPHQNDYSAQPQQSKEHPMRELVAEPRSSLSLPFVVAAQAPASAGLARMSRTEVVRLSEPKAVEVSGPASSLEHQASQDDNALSQSELRGQAAAVSTSPPAGVDLAVRSASQTDANTSPVAAIRSPVDGAYFLVGRPVALMGGAKDAEDAVDALHYHWNVDLVEGDHREPGFFAGSERNVFFTVEDLPQEAGVSLDVRLIVTDTGGLSDTTTVKIYPKLKAEGASPVSPGDVLDVSYYAGGEKQEQFSAEVSSSGTITTPLVGEVSVAGLTAPEVSGKLTTLLSRDFYVNPQVLVGLQEREKQVYVGGEVKKPGAFSIREGSTVLNVCILAGGFTDFAALNRVTVTRTTGKQTRIIKMDLKEVQRGRASDLTLEVGDRIDIPRRTF